MNPALFRTRQSTPVQKRKRRGVNLLETSTGLDGPK